MSSSGGAAGGDFGGREIFDAPPEKLFALLTDLDAMAGTIPDMVSWERTSAHSMNCVVRPGFSFLRGTMKLAIVQSELHPPLSASMSIAAQGIGVAMQVVSHLTISPHGTGSALDWNARIAERKGLIAAVSPGLIKAAADQVIRHAWSAVRAQLVE